MGLHFPLHHSSPLCKGVRVFVPVHLLFNFVADISKYYPEATLINSIVEYGYALPSDGSVREEYGSWCHYNTETDEYFFASCKQGFFETMSLEAVWNSPSLRGQPVHVPLDLSSIYP